MSREGNVGMSKAAATALVFIVLIAVGGFVAIVQVVVTAQRGDGVVITSSNQIAANQTKTVTTLLGSSAGEINQTPSVVSEKIEWCNTGNTGQDRFCSNSITVVQGDIVQVIFIQNDSDAHTFTLTSGPYSFQINDTLRGMADFLANKAAFSESCINGNYVSESAGISNNYCVSGKSLLSPSFLATHGAANYIAEQNPSPAVPFGNASNPHPITIPVSDEVYYGGSSNLSDISIASNATSTMEWGIGAFQASFAGIFEFTCIYHLANGMFGYLTVLPNAYCVTKPGACGLNSSIGIQAARGAPPGSGKNSSGSLVVQIQNGSSTNTNLPGFSSQEFTIVVGVNNTVTWVNDDYSIHTVTANGGSFDSGFIQPNGSFSYTFVTPGTYKYHCSIHAWMTGTVIVLPAT